MSVPTPSPITSPRVKELAGKILRDPKNAKTEEVQELAASVIAHIEPRKS